jgi:hypothetical protein
MPSGHRRTDASDIPPALLHRLGQQKRLKAVAIGQVANDRIVAGLERLHLEPVLRFLPPAVPAGLSLRDHPFKPGSQRRIVKRWTTFTKSLSTLPQHGQRLEPAGSQVECEIDQKVRPMPGMVAREG